MVTPKGEEVSEDFISHLVYPFVVMFFLIMGGYIFGIYRWFEYPDERYIIAMTVAWNSFNLILIMTGLAISSEKGEKRKYVRIPSNEKCRINFAGIPFEGQIEDLSMGGALVRIPEKSWQDIAAIIEQEKARFSVFYQNQDFVTLDVDIIRFREGKLVLKFLGIYENLDLRKKLVALIYGDETRWIDLDERKESPLMIGTLWLIISHSLKNVRFGEIARQSCHYFLRRLRFGV
jgi:cellulose synthase (UDP-forming)